MKFDKDLLKEKWVAYTVALCSAVLLYMLLTHLSVLGHLLAGIWKIGSPVFMALVIAYVMAPLVGMYSKYVLHKVAQDKLRHTLSVLLAVLSVVLFFVILMVALVPQVIDSIVMFVGNLNIYVLSFQQFMRQLSSFAAQHDIDLSQFISSSDEMLQSISRILPENLNKIVNASYGFGAKLFDWIISFILAIYLMLDGRNLRFGFLRLLHVLLPSGVYASSASFWRRCNTILIRYIACDLLDGMIIGLLNWIFMVIMQMPYVAIISVVVGVTNLAPTFGPMAGAVIGAFILVLVKPVYALWFLLFTLVLQTVDGYVIKPRLFGEQLGVSSVWILIALIIGGRRL
ncbi:MAG: AI-2E family transporter, partial [Lachnospiraceae bacterium]|nr:AI-2E family transporter [Lachnospiraceae bacterium]